MDRNNVDLIFALVVPEESQQEHLNTLKEIASAFHHKEFREALRSTHNATELYQIAIEEKSHQATG